MKRLYLVLENSALVIVCFVFITIGWFFSLIIFGLVSKVFPSDGTIYVGVIGATGSILGGLFTLVGVKWTNWAQERAKYWESIPKRLSNLLSINNLLLDIRWAFDELMSLADDDLEGLELHVEAVMNKLENAYILAANVNSECFERINQLSKVVRTALYEMNTAKRLQDEKKASGIVQSIGSRLIVEVLLISERQEELSEKFSSKIKKDEKLF